MKVIINNLDHLGRGIGRIDGKVVFINNALPTEEVEIVITKEKKKFSEGEVVNIIKSSSDRVQPICPHFKECGGCDIMHMNYKDQAVFKCNKVKDIIAKFTDLDETIVDNTLVTEEPFYYRNKTTFHVDEGKIGYYKKGSNEIVMVDKCYISNAKTNKILAKLKTINLKDVYQVVVKCDDEIDEIMVIIYLKHKANVDKIVKLLSDDVTSIVTDLNGNMSIVYGNDSIEYILKDYKFKLSANSFFQVNTNQCLKLYDKVKELAELKEDDILLDLYCGVGTIGIYLSNFVKAVYGVEINEGAVKNAVYNKKLNNIDNIAFYAGDTKNIVKKLDIKPTVIVVDPPRRGLDIITIDYMLESKANKIIYVSCDPNTLARDLMLLKDKYEVKNIIPVDMFPNTNHVECVVTLYRK